MQLTVDGDSLALCALPSLLLILKTEFPPLLLLTLLILLEDSNHLLLNEIPTS